MAQDYYVQRAVAFPGTLLISEATVISPKAGGYSNIPGIWSEQQIAAWIRITTKVRRGGSYIYCQLIAFGRGADPEVLEAEGVGDFVSSSAVSSQKDGPTPRALNEDEILEYIQDFCSAARNAIEAGFDGVEIDAANGFLIDQFIQDTCNKRTDRWGGSVENRSRFALEITKAVIDAIGADRTGIRVSPWSTYQGMKMENPLPQFAHLIHALRNLDLAYLHLISPRVFGDGQVQEGTDKIDPLLNIWGRTSPVLLAGGFNADNAKRAVDQEHADLQLVIVFGRYFISNPDLVWRLWKGVQLRHYDRGSFYKVKSPAGYVDWEFCEEWKLQNAS